MRFLRSSVLVLSLAWAGAYGREAEPPGRGPAAADDTAGPDRVLDLTGRTQPTPARQAKIAPSVSETVTQVLVTRGDRVKAGQPLVKLDDDKAQAELRSKQAALTELQADLKRLLQAGRAPEAAEVERRVRAATAALQKTQAALKQYTLTARIDGVVASLSVKPGHRGKPGEDEWGEILDLREIDVRCELTPEQADRTAVGRSAEVARESDRGTPWKGSVVFVGIAADPSSGRVPVLVRLNNPAERIRPGEVVRVRLDIARRGR